MLNKSSRKLQVCVALLSLQVRQIEMRWGRSDSTEVLAGYYVIERQLLQIGEVDGALDISERFPWRLKFCWKRLKAS